MFFNSIWNVHNLTSVLSLILASAQTSLIWPDRVMGGTKAFTSRCWITSVRPQNGNDGIRNYDACRFPCSDCLVLENVWRMLGIIRAHVDLFSLLHNLVQRFGHPNTHFKSVHWLARSTCILMYYTFRQTCLNAWKCFVCHFSATIIW